MKNLPLLLLLAVSVSGCAPSQTPEERDKFVSDMYAGEMSRVQFDGHLWVVMRSSHAQPFVHHPDCPCGKP